MQALKDDGDEVDLKSRIRDISEKMSLRASVDRASAQRSASSALGVENPVGILAEIRELNERMLDMMKEMAILEEEKEKRNEMRHKEMCTILLGMSSGVVGPTGSGQSAYGQGSPAPQGLQKSQSYYGNTAMITGVHLVSCVMMHIDYMLTRHPKFRKISTSDRTFMDMKEWYVMCSSIINADKTSKAGLRMPKPSDEDFRSACRLVASPVEGRRPNCDPSHLASLIEQSPALINTVEWVRTALLRCPGCLSPERHCRFKSIKYPFVNEQSELNLDMTEKLVMPVRTKHQVICDLKAAEKKEYMRLILELQFSSNDAISRVRRVA